MWQANMKYEISKPIFSGKNKNNSQPKRMVHVHFTMLLDVNFN